MPGTDSASETTPVAIPLEIRVLGPVEIAWNGRPVDVGGVKARALVARLLIDRGLVVSVDRLVDSLSRDHEGQGPDTALRSTISRVRKRLREAGVPGDVIVTRAPGYLLDVPAEVTDVFRFEQLVAEGRRQLSRRRERVRPPPQGGRGTVARTRVQRGTRRAVRPCRGPPPRGAAPLGRGDEDRRGLDDGRSPDPRR